MKKLVKAVILSICLLLTVSPFQSLAQVTQGKTVNCTCMASIELNQEMRRLWIEHSLWTRDYVKSAIGGLDDQEKVLQRLLKNQDDIGNAIKPYYGESAGNTLGGLLREHIVIAGKLVTAAKSGNQADFKKHNTEWYKNAVDISEFLSKANPNWKEKELKDMLYAHLQFVTDIVTARLVKDYDAEILVFDKGQMHLIKLADILSEGIVKQFPEKFN